MKSQNGVHTLQLVPRRQWHSFDLRLLLMASYVAQNSCSKWSVLTVIIEGSLAGSFLGGKSHLFLHRRTNCLWKHQGISNQKEYVQPIYKNQGHCFLFKFQHPVSLHQLTRVTWRLHHLPKESLFENLVKMNSLTIITLRTQIPVDL